jgi:hypothetical protein
LPSLQSLATRVLISLATSRNLGELNFLRIVCNYSDPDIMAFASCT